MGWTLQTVKCPPLFSLRSTIADNFSVRCDIHSAIVLVMDYFFVLAATAHPHIGMWVTMACD